MQSFISWSPISAGDAVLDDQKSHIWKQKNNVTCDILYDVTIFSTKSLFVLISLFFVNQEKSLFSILQLKSASKWYLPIPKLQISANGRYLLHSQKYPLKSYLRKSVFLATTLKCYNFKMNVFQSSLIVWLVTIRNTFSHIFNIRNHDLISKRTKDIK